MESTTPDLITSVFDVFSSIGTWFADNIPSMLSVFWNDETGLTVLGVLALAGLGISIIMMVFNFIRGFFSFGG